jgi:ankyrin repeat protein
MREDYASYELAAPAKMVRDLLAHSADPAVADADGRTPLMMATRQGWRDVVQELLIARLQ